MTHRTKLVTLWCPVCSYTYETGMPGWAFATDKDTKCIGKDVVPDGKITNNHAYNHPFKKVGERYE